MGRQPFSGSPFPYPSPLYLSDQLPLTCIYNWVNSLSYKIQPWRWVQHVPLKKDLSIRHGAIIQKILSCLKILCQMIHFMWHHWQSISFFFLKKLSTSFNFTQKFNSFQASCRKMVWIYLVFDKTSNIIYPVNYKHYSFLTFWYFVCYVEIY